MKVSIVTPVFNADAYIADCIQSIENQDYPNIEHIIVDGKSTDDTMKVVERLEHDQMVVHSEKDEGIYDAMNKGIHMATGDIIGILNADDFYANSGVVSRIVKEFEEKPEIDAVFGELVIVKPENTDKIVRYYQAKNFKPNDFLKGTMPPHPTFFVRAEHYLELGTYDIKYSIGADFELLLRFFKNHNLKFSYIPEVMVRMRAGGASTKNLRSNWIINKEMVAACKSHGYKTSMVKVYSKYFTKVFQLVKRPKTN